MRKNEVSQELITRLKKAEGQLRGIQRMIKEGRECQQILGQLMAVRSAVEKVGLLVVSNEFERCFGKSAKTTPKEAKALEEAIKTAIKL